MMFRAGFAGGIAAMGLATSAAAQAIPSACPGTPLSIYFASGEATASPQTRVLILRIGETAANCGADRIDLVAHISAADGARAVAVALERLNKVASELVAQGLPADRIRVAARAPEQGERVAGPDQIDVLIRKAEATGREPARSIDVMSPSSI